MNQYKRFVLIGFIGLLLFPALSFGQESTQDMFTRRFQNGTQLFRISRWSEAAIEFRRAQELSRNLNDWAASLYWVILSELAATDFGSALRDMDQLEIHAPNSPYARDMIYHRARVYFILGFFEDAIVLFNRYLASTSDSDPVTANRRAAAFFWIGESLFAMRQWDEAERFYAWVVARHLQSPKREASVYRLDLIKQRRIEAELLALLQLTHEEMLRTSEAYRRTIRTQEHTLNLYQRRLMELTVLNQNNQANGGVGVIDVLPLFPQEITEPEIEDTIVIPDVDFAIYNNGNGNGNGRCLIEKAIELGNEVEQILRETNGNGGEHW
ncbi:MAG: hypothetical protein FWC97_02915 [Treponema sp.]|nr:hypothetical protein [Treponema sp.]